MNKKILALLVSLILLIMCVPVASAQVEDICWVARMNCYHEGHTNGPGCDPAVPPYDNDYFVSTNGYMETYWCHAFDMGGAAQIHIKYSVPVVTAGVYELKAKCGSDGSVFKITTADTTVNATIDGGWGNRTEKSLAFLNLTEGNNEITLENAGNASICAFYFILSYVEPESPVVESFKAGGIEFCADDTIARGTDIITVNVNNNIRENSLNEAEISLIGEDGSTVGLKVSVENKTVKLSLLDTLDYGIEYTLSISGLKDSYGNSIDSSVTFTTTDANSDSGVSTVMINTVENVNSDRTVAVQGVVKNSSGDGISGRSAQLTIYAPDLSQVAVLEEVSEADGIVEFSHTLSDDAPSGSYTVSLTGEYVLTPAVGTFLYDSDALGGETTSVEDICWVARKDFCHNFMHPDGTGCDTTVPGYANDYFVSTNGSMETYWCHACDIGGSSQIHMKYSVPVVTAGVYELKAKCGSNGSVFRITTGDTTVNATIDGGWGNRTEKSLAILNLTEGYNEITLENVGDASICAFYFTLSYVEPPVVESFKAGGIEFCADDTIARGTDMLTVNVNRNINENSLNEAEISLIGEDGSTVGLKASAENKTVKLSLLDTLDYGTDYTLSLSNVKDTYGYSIDTTVDFTTTDANSDSGMSSVVINSAEDVKSGKTIKVVGVVKNSSGDGISGRTAQLTIYAPDLSQVAILEKISGADGIVEFSHTLSDNALSGSYTVSLTGEYVLAPAVDTLLYVSDALREEILGKLKATTQAESATVGDETAVNQLFVTYEIVLGLTLSELDALNDVSLFYNWFVGKEYNDVTSFTNDFNAYFALEQLGQATTGSATKAILDNPVCIAALGIDAGRAALLNTQADAFYQAVADLPRQVSLSDLTDAYHRIANQYLMLEMGKTDITMTATNQNVYVGKLAEAAITSTAVNDLTSYVLAVDCQTAAAAEKLGYVMNGEEVVSKTVSGTVASFHVTGLSDNAYESFGTLTYAPDSAGNTLLSVTGNGIYQLDGVAYPITCSILPFSVTVTTTANTDKSTPGVSYSPGGGGGAGGVTVGTTSPSKPTEPEKPTKDEPFDDIYDVEWATDSIMTLYRLGVISDSETGQYRPNDPVSRAEFVKMLVQALGIQDKMLGSDFADVATGSWYYSYVASAEAKGFITGDENGHFHPDGEITRQDICVILSRVMDQMGYAKEEYATIFVDDVEISEYAKNAVYRLYDFKVINGMGNGLFMPRNMATRAMIAKMLEGFLKGVEVL